MFWKKEETITENENEKKNNCLQFTAKCLLLKWVVSNFVVLTATKIVCNANRQADRGRDRQTNSCERVEVSKVIVLQLAATMEGQQVATKCCTEFKVKVSKHTHSTVWLQSLNSQELWQNNLIWIYSINAEQKSDLC